MRTKDYEAEYSRTVRIFLASVFLLHILEVELGLTSCFLVELAIAEMACVSRNIRGTFHVPSGVPVQRSISERDCSHPALKKSLKLLLQTLRVVESYPFTKFDKIPLIKFR